MASAKPQFGIDAPGVVKTLGGIGFGLLAVTALGVLINQPAIAR